MDDLIDLTPSRAGSVPQVSWFAQELPNIRISNVGASLLAKAECQSWMMWLT
ncbi:hypothetical protein HU724_011935 [Pseudomonas iranensis]|uniref:hypothetical protein n=1 Tax=Pseudomonas iranensis TaxID=2745503 RepID=UPI001C3DAE82|nr:hypothetical protein [Pseudomonas iranensis]QXI24946.1 hypothetical protein HU724_011935 [Pseudomonas iranensis]